MGKKYQILTPEGFEDFKGVKKTVKNKKICLKFDNGEKIECSENHILDTPYGNMQVKSLFTGSPIVTKDGFAKVVSKESIKGPVDLYDIVDIKNNEKLYIANKTYSHNCAIILPSMWNEFAGSTFPTIAEGKTNRVLLVSTPKGKNHFYKYWHEALMGSNGYAPIKVLWDMVPGRDLDWKTRALADLENPEDFTQEYECDFTGVSGSLLNKNRLKLLKYKNPIPRSQIQDLYDQLKGYEDYVSVFLKPEVGHEYAIGYDSAKMTKKSKGDSISAHVLDVTTLPFKHAAEINVPKNMFYLEGTEILKALLLTYNRAKVFIENNETGQEIANALYFEHGFTKEVFCERYGLPGFRTTNPIKVNGCGFLKTLIENDALEVNGYNFISQICNFIKVGKTYKADEGYLDDSIMAMLASIVFLQYKQEIINTLFPNSKLPSKTDFLSAVKTGEYKACLDNSEESKALKTDINKTYDVSKAWSSDDKYKNISKELGKQNDIIDMLEKMRKGEFFF